MNPNKHKNSVDAKSNKICEDFSKSQCLEENHCSLQCLDVCKNNSLKILFEVIQTSR